MSTQSDGWIKTSERMPTEADLPVWGIKASEGYRPFLVTDENWPELAPGQNGREAGFNGWATHWKPAALPEPPKKEMTQRERDEEALEAWKQSQLNFFTGRNDAWHAALAYRDAQNREDLNRDAWGAHCIDGACANKAIYNLRRRAGLT